MVAIGGGRSDRTPVTNDTYDVFVSYSRGDWRHAAEIDSTLRAKGLKPFFDRRNLAPPLRVGDREGRRRHTRRGDPKPRARKRRR
jgi:hypothetical protein